VGFWDGGYVILAEFKSKMTVFWSFFFGDLHELRDRVDADVSAILRVISPEKTADGAPIVFLLSNEIFSIITKSGSQIIPEEIAPGIRDFELSPDSCGWRFCMIITDTLFVLHHVM
jgi:hypothetical protein